jgi:ABC-2 type transport system ATP-binding protein
MAELYSLSVENLHKTLGLTPALAGLSFSFRAGAMHGLIGPDGAGKTTLLRCLIGLLSPNSGAISYAINGEPVAFSRARGEIAYMPQQQSLYADLSIDEHLQFFRAMYQIPRAEYMRRRDQLLAITRLGEFITRPAGKLSGGMYKKLGLMCALLRSPRVLLLDEPTNGVDPISRREFWEHLNGLQEDKILIIVATAYMDEAERCAAVHLMDRGRALAEGEPKALRAARKVQKIEQLFSEEAAREG